MKALKIRTGDQVLVLAGKDKGKKGKVLQVFPVQQRVVVEGVNQMTKNVRARKEKETNKPPKAFREIFRVLKDMGI